MTTAGAVGSALDGLEAAMFSLALQMASLYDSAAGTPIPNLNEMLARLQHLASQLNKIDAAAKAQMTQALRAAAQGT